MESRPYQLVGGSVLTLLGRCQFRCQFRCVCPAYHRFSHCQLGLRRIACHFFHGLRNLLACAFAVQCKTGQLLKHLHRTADRLNQLAPVNLAYQAQAVDDVADGQVGRHLGRLTVSNGCNAVHAMQVDPVHQHRIGVIQLVRYTLPELGQKAALQTSGTHTCQQCVQIIFRQAAWRVPHRMGDFTGGFAFSNVISHSPQVFKQHHPQRGGHGPQFAQTELIHFLISMQKCCEKRWVQHTVGVGHIGPCNAVYPGQPRQRFACQLGQIGIVTARHAFVNLL